MKKPCQKTVNEIQNKAATPPPTKFVAYGTGTGKSYYLMQQYLRFIEAAPQPE